VPWGDLQALGLLQRKLNVDILVSGQTHKFLVRIVNEFCLKPCDIHKIKIIVLAAWVVWVGTVEF
jgi:predicted phosphodiesterase